MANNRKEVQEGEGKGVLPGDGEGVGKLSRWARPVR